MYATNKKSGDMLNALLNRMNCVVLFEDIAKGQYLIEYL